MAEEEKQKKQMPKFLGSKWFYAGAGLLVGALIILGIRFFFHVPHRTHYHANFAVFIDGKREEFKDPSYYQEIAACSDAKVTPVSRVHMHDEINDVINVHHDAVTWGQFFENLGWFLGDDFIKTPNALLTSPEGQNKLHIVLNGRDITNITTITNQVIGDKDRLLVSYGDEDAATLKKQYEVIPNSAAEYNSKSDPASCKGSEGETWQEKLKNLF